MSGLVGLPKEQFYPVETHMTMPTISKAYSTGNSDLSGHLPSNQGPVVP